MKRAIALFFLLTSCATEQQRTHFGVDVEGAPLTAPSEAGWTITLETARATVGPLRFFEGKVLISRLERLLWAPFGGIAHAHPGHYIPGEALAELTVSHDVDLLAGITPLGDADAVTGDYGSLELTVTSVRVAGTATKGTDSRRFEASYDLAKPLEGVRSEHTLGLGTARARLTIAPGRWLHGVDFTTTTDPDGDGIWAFADGTQALNAFARGVTDTGAYTITWAEEQQE